VSRRVVVVGGGNAALCAAIAARQGGAEVLGISLVTNPGAGLTDEPLNHEEVLAAGKAAAERMGALLATVLERL
jgi:purine-nucleoside phosphorylase